MTNKRSIEDVISRAHRRLRVAEPDVIPGHAILLALREAGYELIHVDSDNWRDAIGTREAIRDEFYKIVQEDYRTAEQKLAAVVALRDRLAAAKTWDERPDIVSAAYADLITEALNTVGVRHG